eukprot:Skav203785  [mRNA]  locus=scaffold206:431933:438994:+ [translate_table: standard]
MVIVLYSTSSGYSYSYPAFLGTATGVPDVAVECWAADGDAGVSRTRGKKVPSKREEAPDRASVFGTEMKKGPKKEFLPPPSKNAYKMKEASGRMEELQRNARSLLNKICPDNLGVIVDQLASIKLHKAEELECVIRIIFKKALAEPHYCETYADMVFALKERYPQFPPENEGQNEFENMPATFEATDEDRAKCPHPDDLQQELLGRWWRGGSEAARGIPLYPSNGGANRRCQECPFTLWARGKLPSEPAEA